MNHQRLWIQKNGRSILAFLTTMLFIFLLSKTLYHNPFKRQSILVGQKVPDFYLPSLFHQGAPLERKMIQNQITLIHFFGSWCGYCQQEYAHLKSLSETISILWIGIDFKDEKETALHMIQQRTSPYQVIGFDPTGKVAIDFGVVGAPETFVMDGSGWVRLHHQGPLTPAIWHNELLPVIQKLKQDEQ